MSSFVAPAEKCVGTKRFLPTRALFTSRLVSMTLLKKASPVGLLNLLGAFSSANQRRCGDIPNKFGTPVLRSGGLSHSTTFFNKILDTSLCSYSTGALAQRLTGEGLTPMCTSDISAPGRLPGPVAPGPRAFANSPQGPPSVWGVLSSTSKMTKGSPPISHFSLTLAKVVSSPTEKRCLTNAGEFS